jgi:hypothetical protein
LDVDLHEQLETRRGELGGYGKYMADLELGGGQLAFTYGLKCGGGGGGGGGVVNYMDPQNLLALPVVYPCTVVW